MSSDPTPIDVLDAVTLELSRFSRDVVAQVHQLQEQLADGRDRITALERQIRDLGVSNGRNVSNEHLHVLADRQNVVEADVASLTTSLRKFDSQAQRIVDHVRTCTTDVDIRLADFERRLDTSAPATTDSWAPTPVPVPVHVTTSSQATPPTPAQSPVEPPAPGTSSAASRAPGPPASVDAVPIGPPAPTHGSRSLFEPRVPATPAPEVAGRPPTETPAPDVAGRPPTETPAPEVAGRPPTETPAPEVAGRPPTETPAPEVAGRPPTDSSRQSGSDFKFEFAPLGLDLAAIDTTPSASAEAAGSELHDLISLVINSDAAIDSATDNAIDTDDASESAMDNAIDSDTATDTAARRATDTPATIASATAGDSDQTSTPDGELVTTGAAGSDDHR